MTHTIKLDDGTKLAIPKEYLSFSQIGMYLKCPAQYKFRYIDGIKSPPGVALAEGSSGHAAMELSNNHQIAQGEVLPHGKLYERFADEFSTRRHEIEDWGDKTCKDGIATPDQINARAKIYLKTFAEQIAPDFTPIASEAEHRVLMGGVPILLYTDMEQDNSIWDYKVSKSSSPYFHSGAAEKSIQLSIYAAATGKMRTGFIGLLKNKPETYKMVEAKKTPGDIAYATRVITDVARAISKGSFPMCGPDQFLCNPKWCGYWSRCRGKLLATGAPKFKATTLVPKITVVPPTRRKSPPKRSQSRRSK